MRWPIFFILTFTVGLAQMFLRPTLNFPAPGVELELLFLIGYCTAQNCRPTHIMVAFWWCGLMQDLFLGSHLGANTLLFILPAIAVASLRSLALQKHALTQAAVSFVLLLAILLPRPLVEYQALRIFMNPMFWKCLLASALYSSLMTPVVNFTMQTNLFRTWPRVERSFGLPEAN